MGTGQAYGEPRTRVWGGGRGSGGLLRDAFSPRCFLGVAESGGPRAGLWVTCTRLQSGCFRVLHLVCGVGLCL